MKPIYHFDCGTPPVINRKILAAKMEQRRVQRQMILLSLAGLLITVYLGANAILLYPINPILSIAWLVYICAAVWGSVAVAVIFSMKRSEQSCILLQ